MNKTHILFLASDDSFVLDSVMEVASVTRYPAVKYKSRFKSKAILTPLAGCLSSTIKDHKFALLFDTKLDLLIKSDEPIQFNLDLVSKTFSNSGLKLFQIALADNHFVITNLLNGKKQNVSLDDYDSSSYMVQFDPAWKNVVRVHKQPTEENIAYLLDDIENIELP